MNETKTKIKIVGVDKVYVYPEDLERLKKFGEVIMYSDVPSESEGIDRIRDADIVIDNWFDMPANVIVKAPKLKMISVAAIGYEWIDLREASKRKIVVSNCPAYCAEDVAEHTIGLMVAAARHLSKSERDIRGGKWGPTTYQGKRLNGKSLLVVGYGSIGKRVAQIAQKGFRMNVKYVNSKTSKGQYHKLLRESDIVAIALPLNEKTRGFVSNAEFQVMKPGVIIVNTGRGAVIDEQSLLKNLKSGKVFAAGLDVLTIEPMDKNNPLFSLPNVTITPHIAFNTEESQRNLSKIIVDNVISFIQGKPQNIVS